MCVTAWLAGSLLLVFFFTSATRTFSPIAFSFRRLSTLREKRARGEKVKAPKDLKEEVEMDEV